MNNKFNWFLLLLNFSFGCKSNMNDSVNELQSTDDQKVSLYDSNSSKIPMDPVVPQINSEGVKKIVKKASSESGYNPVVSRTFSFECGLEGNIEKRIKDCEKNQTQKLKTTIEDPNHDELEKMLYSWSLVSSMKSSESSELNDYYQVWRDNKTNLIWSDKYGGINVFKTNWCKASGSNNKSNSPLSENDSDSICNTAKYQDQTDPVSYCAEDSQFLAGKIYTSKHKVLEKNYAKAGLSKEDAGGNVTWWLPTIDQFREAQIHGADLILPNSTNGINSWFWTSSIDNRREKTLEKYALIFKGETGSVLTRSRRQEFSVRCVGKSIK
jgi:hypothetical protein